MATLTFNRVSNDSCTLSVLLDGVQKSPIMVGVVTFPYTFNPENHNFGPDDINGTYTFDCDGCIYEKVVDSYVPTTTTTTTKGIVVIATTTTRAQNEGPVITLNSGTDTLSFGSTWSDAGATATDDEDGDLTSNIVVTNSNVNGSSAGTYTITYTVTDSEGMSDSVDRTVIVESQLITTTTTKAPTTTTTTTQEVTTTTTTEIIRPLIYCMVLTGGRLTEYTYTDGNGFTQTVTFEGKVQSKTVCAEAGSVVDVHNNGSAPTLGEPCVLLNGVYSCVVMATTTTTSTIEEPSVGTCYRVTVTNTDTYSGMEIKRTLPEMSPSAYRLRDEINLNTSDSHIYDICSEETITQIRGNGDITWRPINSQDGITIQTMKSSCMVDGNCMETF